MSMFLGLYTSIAIAECSRLCRSWKDTRQAEVLLLYSVLPGMRTPGHNVPLMCYLGTTVMFMFIDSKYLPLCPSP